jgi:2-oxo-4-hydroxy-4-carboxy--5-ureidoimidazoline (OHCU) decarboxylase
VAVATGFDLDALDRAAFEAAVAPLFEGAPGFLSRLAAARPFGTPDAMFDAAMRIARAMPEPEQIELLDAHPRIGAPPGSVSADSFREQGYDRDTAGAAAEQERARIQDALDRLNRAYEARFGFRFVVFVAGRRRSEIVPELERRLELPRDDELETGLRAVVDIARDRWRKRP